MRANERRIKLWLIVFRKRYVSVHELSQELEVSIRTIKYDIAYMLSYYPIDTVRGRYGGCVKLTDCKVKLNGVLTDQQIDFLIHKWSEMKGVDATIMWDIVTALTSPKNQ